MTHRPTKPAMLALLTGIGLLGFTPIFVRLSEIGPIATAFWRIAFALPVLWLWMLLEQSPHKPVSRSDFLWLVLIGLFFTGDLATWQWGVMLTTVANATLLANLAPIFVTLGAWLWLGENVRPQFVWGLMGAIVGATLLMGNSFRLASQYFWGDLLSLTTAFFYAGYILSVKRMRHGFSVATVMAWSGLVMCLNFLVIATLSGETLLPVSINGWLVLLGLAWVSHVGGQGLLSYALAHLKVSYSSVTLLTHPVVAALLAWIILNEQLILVQIMGGIIVLGSIYLTRRRSRTDGTDG